MAIAVPESDSDLIHVFANTLRESATCAPKAKESNATEIFYKWLLDNGVIMPKIKVAAVGGMRGLIALDDIKKDEICIKVPDRIIISVDTVMSSKIGKFNWNWAMNEGEKVQRDHSVMSSPPLLLAMYLILESRNEDSRWTPYLDVLPRAFGTPFYFEAGEILSLKDSLVYDEITSLMRTYLFQYNHVRKYYIKTASFAEFMWATSVVMTRQNLVPTKGGGRQNLALVPGWDMGNHEDGDITAGYDDAEDCLYMHSMKSFKAGEEVTMSYGHRGPLDYFIYSGWIPEKYTETSFRMKLSFPQKDPLLSKRLEVLKRDHLPPSPSGTFVIDPKSLKDSSVLIFLRIMLASSSELNQGIPDDGELTQKALRWLSIKIQVLLKKLESSPNVENLSDHLKKIRLIQMQLLQITQQAIRNL